MKKSLKLRVALVLASSIFAAAQATIPPAIPAAKHPTPPTDALGRTSPRGAVLGFLRAAGKGDYDTAAAYLNTPMRGPAAEDLARQLSVVLDRRLPTRLNELSDQPDGSIPFPTTPDLDLVGSIGTDSGDIDILLERVISRQSRLSLAFLGQDVGCCSRVIRGGRDRIVPERSAQLSGENDHRTDTAVAMAGYVTGSAAVARRDGAP